MRHFKHRDQQVFRDKAGKTSSFTAASRNHLQLQMCINLRGSNEENEEKRTFSRIWLRLIWFKFPAKDRTLPEVMNCAPRASAFRCEYRSSALRPEEIPLPRTRRVRPDRRVQQRPRRTRHCCRAAPRAGRQPRAAEVGLPRTEKLARTLPSPARGCGAAGGDTSDTIPRRPPALRQRLGPASSRSSNRSGEGGSRQRLIPPTEAQRSQSAPTARHRLSGRLHGGGGRGRRGGRGGLWRSTPRPARPEVNSVRVCVYCSLLPAQTRRIMVCSSPAVGGLSAAPARPAAAPFPPFLGAPA